MCQWVLVRVLYSTLSVFYHQNPTAQTRSRSWISRTSPAARALYRTEQSQGSSPTQSCGSSHPQTPVLVGLGKLITRVLYSLQARGIVPENWVCLYGHLDTGASIIGRCFRTRRGLFCWLTALLLYENQPLALEPVLVSKVFCHASIALILVLGHFLPGTGTSRSRAQLWCLHGIMVQCRKIEISTYASFVLLA